MADLPAYSGPLAECPKCGRYGVETEWHLFGGVFAPGEVAGRRPPCKKIDALADLDGEHLCRLCRNCGYGWVEACADSRSREAGQLRPVPGEEATGP